MPREAPVINAIFSLMRSDGQFPPLRQDVAVKHGAFAAVLRVNGTFPNALFCGFKLEAVRNHI